jgi:hypothetical protein
MQVRSCDGDREIDTGKHIIIYSCNYFKQFSMAARNQKQKQDRKLIMKVCVNRKTGQKYVTVPKDEKDIQGGDYVRIEKVE